MKYYSTPHTSTPDYRKCSRRSSTHAGARRRYPGAPRRAPPNLRRRIHQHRRHPVPPSRRTHSRRAQRLRPRTYTPHSTSSFPHSNTTTAARQNSTLHPIHRRCRHQPSHPRCHHQSAKHRRPRRHVRLANRRDRSDWSSPPTQRNCHDTTDRGLTRLEPLWG